MCSTRKQVSRQLKHLIDFRDKTRSTLELDGELYSLMQCVQSSLGVGKAVTVSSHQCRH